MRFLQPIFAILAILFFSGCSNDIDFNERPEMVETVYNACQSSSEHGYPHDTCANAALILYSMEEKEQRELRSQLKQLSIKELNAQDCDTAPGQHTKLSKCDIKNSVLKEMKGAIDMEFSFISLEDLKRHDLFDCQDDSYRCQSFKNRLKASELEREQVNQEILSKEMEGIAKLDAKDFISTGYRNACNDTFMSFITSPESSFSDVMVMDPDTGILYPDIPLDAAKKDLVIEPYYKTCAAIEKLYPSYFIRAIQAKRQKFNSYIQNSSKLSYITLYKKAKKSCPSISPDFPKSRVPEEIQYQENEYCLALETLMSKKRAEFVADRRAEFVDIYRRYEGKTTKALFELAEKYKCDPISGNQYAEDILPTSITLPTDNIYCKGIRKALHNQYDTEMMKMQSKSYATGKANECIKEAFSILKMARNKKSLTGTIRQKVLYESYLNRHPYCQASKNVLNVISWTELGGIDCHIANQTMVPSQKCSMNLFPQ